MNDPSQLDDLAADALMGQVVDDFLDRLQRGERPEVEDYVRRHPQLAAVLRQMLPALALVRTSPTDGAEAGQDLSGEVHPEGLLGDFRLIREVGRGGMGVVYEAVQISLGRRVALKVLPFAAALDARQLQRFKTEAQAAAALHHEHIVPVYGVGCERGVHYYAMQLIDGQPLSALIASEAQPEAAATEQMTLPTRAGSSSRGRHNAEFYRNVARMGIEAALALAHAHEQGVVHRDVKPANLLLDGAGKLWVTDFGLAQVQSDTRLTMTGDLLGTLRYMAPEQALGQPALVGPRSDVYSLGVTLYELLTGRPTFPASDRQELLGQISAGEVVPPRRIDRGIPAELETVVLKALARSPADRYESARELADDLRRFLDDRPVKARRPSLAQRLGKWARRHRAVVTAAAAGLAVVFVVLVIASVLLAAAYHAERTARREAEERLDIARQAIEKWYVRFGSYWLADEPHMDQIQQDYLNEAIHLYEVFARLQQNNPRDRLGAGASYMRLGELRSRLGQFEQAEKDLRTSLDLLEPDRADEVQRNAVRADRAAAYGILGRVLSKQRRMADAEGAFLAARGLYLDLRERVPGNVPYAYGLAGLEMERATALFNQERHKEAVIAYRDAEMLLTWVVQQDTTHARALSTLGEAVTFQARECLRKNDQAGAKTLLDRAIGYQHQASRLEPRFRSHRVRMLDNHLGLARLLKAEGDLAGAARTAGQAVALGERLVEQFPHVPDFRAHLANASYRQGGYLRLGQRHDEARALLERARKLYLELVRDFPTREVYKDLLVNSHAELGKLLLVIGRPWPAVSELRQAVQLARQLKWGAKTRPDRCRLLASHHLDLGRALRSAKEAGAAEHHLAQGLALAREVVARPDAAPEDRHTLLRTSISLGRLWLDAGRLDEARRLFEQAIALGEGLVKNSSTTPEYRWRLVLARNGMRDLLVRSEQHAAAESLRRSTLNLLDELVRQAPDHPRYRQELAQQLEEHARELGRARELDAAWEALRRSLDVRKELADRFPAEQAHPTALAAAYLRAALERNSFGLPSGREHAGEIQVLFRQAIAVLEPLCERSDQRKDTAAGREPYRLLALASHKLGDHLRQAGASPEALRRIRRSIELYTDLLIRAPRDVRLLEALGSSQNSLGVVLLGMRRYPEGEGAFREALDTRQRLLRLGAKQTERVQAVARTCYGLARTVAAQGRYAQALGYCRASLKHDPRYVPCKLCYADLLTSCPEETLRDPARAVGLARAALKAGTDTPASRRVLAQALFRTGAWQEARDLLVELVRGKALTADCFYLAMTEWHLKDAEAARLWLRRGEAGVQKHRETIEKHPNVMEVQCLRQVQAEARKLITSP